MYIIYVNHDSVIKQICQLRDKAFLINETACRARAFTFSIKFLWGVTFYEKKVKV